MAQLVCGISGLMVAIRRRRAYDIPFMTGTPENVARDALWMGTAFSAPAPMLAAQTLLTAVIASRDSRRAARGLQLLGALMVPGYLAERQVRHRLRPDGWDRIETPLVVLGLGLAAVMAVQPPPRA